MPNLYFFLYTCVNLDVLFFFFFFNDTATTEIYTLSLHDALPICPGADFVKQDQGRRLTGLDHGSDVCDVRGDRKSTRLNSSHSQISYAVFCLKKKKKKVDDQHEHQLTRRKREILLRDRYQR